MMSFPIPSGYQTGGAATAIVRTLRDYGFDRPIPIGLVARLVGRTSDEIRDSLDALASKDVVRIDESGETVTLIR